MNRNYFCLALLILLVFFNACKEDPVEIQPSDIDWSRNFLDAKEGSTWQYVNTLNGDTFETPRNLILTGGDSLIAGKSYTVIYKIFPDESLFPFYIQTNEGEQVIQAHAYNEDPANILHLPVIDFSKDLKEKWTLNLSDAQRQDFYFDSLDLEIKGFSGVFKIVSDNYLAEELNSETWYYFHPETGLIRRQNEEFANGNIYITELVDSDVNY